MKFCSSCGSADITHSIPKDDNRLRFVCASCEEIFYHNPKMVVGCIAEWQGKILMCKRAIEPRHGKWTLPAGFMENEETVHAAAARETQEEAQAEVANMSLYTIYNLPHISQVYIMFRADLVAGKASPGIESLEVALMDEAEIPWDDLAFPVIRESLLHYFEDRRHGEFTMHYGDIRRLENTELEIKHY